MNEARRVEKLRADHSIESFDCSREELNRYLLRYASQNQQAGVGIRAFAVHAKDEVARRFYLKFDFMPSPSDPLHLFVLLKDVRRIVSGQ